MWNPFVDHLWPLIGLCSWYLNCELISAQAPIAQMAALRFLPACRCLDFPANHTTALCQQRPFSIASFQYLA